MTSKIINTKQDESIEVHINDSGTTKKSAEFDSTGGLIIGTDPNNANNIKLHRSLGGSLQVVPGNDTTPDGAHSSVESTFLGAVPIGTIIAWNPGFFIDPLNNGYTPAPSIGAVDIPTANAFLNPKGWYIADGSEPAIAWSPIWNTTFLFLPNLTDERFLMGGIAPGIAAGSNTMLDHTHDATHTHAIDHDHSSLSITNGGNHRHSIGPLASGAGADSPNCKGTDNPDYVSYANTNYSTHNHPHGEFSGTSYSGSSGAASSSTVGSGSAASATENRPQYLSTFFIVRVF